MGILHAAITNSLPGHDVAAMCDSDSLLLKLAKKAIPSLNFYSNYAEMIEQENLDAVFVCTPVQTHRQVTQGILSRNNQVSLFVEKPLASSYEEASAMVSDAKKTAGITMVGYQKRFEGVFRKTKELLQNGILGELSFFRSHFFSSSVLSENQGWKFKKGSGGATLEYGVHLLDLLIWFFDEPVSARSAKASIFSSGVEDYIHSNVEFTSGLKGNLEVGWSMRNYQVPDLMIETHGKNGSLTVTEDRVVVILDKTVQGIMEEGVHTFFASALDQPVPFLIAHPENVLQEKHFLESVDARKMPEQNFEAATKVNKFVDLLLSN
jgi:predicted dehydrogenase